MNGAAPQTPKNRRWYSTTGGRELRLEDSPPCSFNWQSKFQKDINLPEPEEESKLTSLLRTPGVFYP
jgi:hypothetical protein